MMNMIDPALSSRAAAHGPEDPLASHAPDFVPEQKYSILFACTLEMSHQASSLVNMVEIFRETFQYENYSIWTQVKNFGYLAVQDELRRKINNFDILALLCGKPIFDFHFFRELKAINPNLVIIYIDGDTQMNFPTYTEHLIQDIDLFVSIDSIEGADIISQLGPRAICLGNWCTLRDFFPVAGVKKDINVSFYGGPKGNRKQFLRFLGNQDVGLQCFGSSFGLPMDQHKLNEIINRSKIGLSFNETNFSPDKLRMPRNFRLARQLKGHIFEHFLCKTFVLSEHVDKIDRYFIPGRELVSFEGENDLLDKIRFYLEHEYEREAIAEAGYLKTIKCFEGGVQVRKMANLIVKCTNIRRGYAERFSSDIVKYDLTPCPPQGNYRPTKKHFVNLQFSIAARLWRRGSHRAALQQLRSLKYGLPYLYLRTRLKFFMFGKLGLLRRWLRARKIPV